MASELLGRRHLAEVDPLQSREIGSSVAVRAKFESSSDHFRRTPCFVMFRSPPRAPRGWRSARSEWNPARTVEGARSVRRSSETNGRAIASPQCTSRRPNCSHPCTAPRLNRQDAKIAKPSVNRQAKHKKRDWVRARLRCTVVDNAFSRRRSLTPKICPRVSGVHRAAVGRTWQLGDLGALAVNPPLGRAHRSRLA